MADNITKWSSYMQTVIISNEYIKIINFNYLITTQSDNLNYDYH